MSFKTEVETFCLAEDIAMESQLSEAGRASLVP